MDHRSSSLKRKFDSQQNDDDDFYQTNVNRILFDSFPSETVIALDQEQRVNLYKFMRWLVQNYEPCKIEMSNLTTQMEINVPLQVQS